MSSPKSTTLLIKLATRLGLLAPTQHWTWEFFSHSPWVLRLYGLLARLDTQADRYVVDSLAEAALFSRKMKVPSDRFLVEPCSDWDESEPRRRDVLAIDRSDRYFFSGGYSNRDYIGLIEAFRGLPHERLVIVCSSINKEIDEASLPPNVSLLRDRPFDEFQALIRHAVATILPLRDRSEEGGGAGQAVIVASMKFGTPVIITDSTVVREYVVNGVCGHLIDSLSELKTLLPRANVDDADYRAMMLASRQRYEERYSYAAVTARVEQLLGLGT